MLLTRCRLNQLSYNWVYGFMIPSVVCDSNKYLYRDFQQYMVIEFNKFSGMWSSSFRYFLLSECIWVILVSEANWYFLEYGVYEYKRYCSDTMIKV
jgi:hypothetical protein